MPRRLPTILVVLTFLLSTNSFAKKIYYKINHDSCRMKIVNTFKSKEDLVYKNYVLDLLKERKYKTSFLKPNKKIIAGDFYLKFTWHRSGEKIYKDCDVDVVMKRSRVDRIHSDDKVVFEKTSKRALPRHTFKGKERCRRAITDVFNLLPHCILKK